MPSKLDIPRNVRATYLGTPPHIDRYQPVKTIVITHDMLALSHSHFDPSYLHTSHQTIDSIGSHTCLSWGHSRLLLPSLYFSRYVEQHVLLTPITTYVMLPNLRWFEFNGVSASSPDHHASSRDFPNFVPPRVHVLYPKPRNLWAQ